MKILPLLSGLLLSGGLLADMDKICVVDYSSSYENDLRSQIKKKGCERNNILRIRGARFGAVTHSIAQYCRHDREINFHEVIGSSKDGSYYQITCVLYSNIPREEIN